MPPKSITTMSPVWIGLSPTWWCGLAPFGPEPTSAKSTFECPCWLRSAAISAEISDSLRPANRIPTISSNVASAAAPAAASSSSSSASFTARSIVGAAVVCIAYVACLYTAVLLIVHQAAGRWPDHIFGPGLALAAAVTMLVALSLLGSVFLSATANGIAVFTLYGAGLVSGLLASIGATLGAQTLLTISHDIEIALPFAGFYSAALHALGSNQTGFARVVVNLGPFGSSNARGAAFYVWAVF
jgi:hypothetical protein